MRVNWVKPGFRSDLDLALTALLEYFGLSFESAELLPISLSFS